MHIELNSESLSAAINAAVSAAVAQGVGSWDLKSAIAAAATEAISNCNLPALVGAELARVLDKEVEQLVANAIQEALPALRLAVSMSAKQMSARMMFGLRQGPSTYLESDKKIWEECLAAVSTPLARHETDEF